MKDYSDNVNMCGHGELHRCSQLWTYFIRRVVEKERLALEPGLDGQSDFAEVIAPEYVLVPNNELESAHCLSQREVDGKFKSGMLWGIDRVECGFNIRSLFSFTKKRDDYIAVGIESATDK